MKPCQTQKLWRRGQLGFSINDFSDDHKYKLNSLYCSLIVEAFRAPFSITRVLICLLPPVYSSTTRKGT